MTALKAGRSKGYAGLPPKRSRGLRIGLFGGSFDPPHEGHRLASLLAMRRLQLDRIWWLVSPGNPLKDVRGLPASGERLRAACRVADHPRIDVTTVEAGWHLVYTADLIDALVSRCRGVHFVWIMGADNLRGFHRWYRWTAITRRVPIAVVDRPGATHRALGGSASSYLSRWRRPEMDAARVPAERAPAFVFLHGPRSQQSSTALRRRLVRPGDKDGRRES